MKYVCVFYKALISLIGTNGAQSWTLTNAMEIGLATGKEIHEKNIRAKVFFIMYGWLSGLLVGMKLSHPNQQTRQPPILSERYQCRIETVSSSDDGHIVARNM